MRSIDRYLISSLAFCLLTIQTVYARINIHTSAGVGLSYISWKNTNMSYAPFVTPHVSAIAAIPVVKKLNLETGLIYAQKGSFNRVKDNYGGTKVTYTGQLRFHYINVPLMLSYNIYNTKQGKLWLGGGMNYGFFIAGTETAKVIVEENGKIISENKQKYPVKGAISKARYISEPSGKFVNALDVMVRFNLRYELRDKYTIGLFHDHSLYDIEAQRLSDASSILKLRYTGISFGFKF